MSKPVLSILVCVTFSATVAAAEPMGRRIRPGESVDLFAKWKDAAKAPRDDYTFEVWLRPDAQTIGRKKSLLFFLTNRGGSDLAGFGVSMTAGAPTVNAFGDYLKPPVKLRADRWTHMALTYNSRTINPQVVLWLDGKRVDETLALNPWPSTFQRFQLLGDPWGVGRHFSGRLGDFRLSRGIRYQKPFEPDAQLSRDQATLLLAPAKKSD